MLHYLKAIPRHYYHFALLTMLLLALYLLARNCSPPHLPAAPVVVIDSVRSNPTDAEVRDSTRLKELGRKNY